MNSCMFIMFRNRLIVGFRFLVDRIRLVRWFRGFMFRNGLIVYVRFLMNSPVLMKSNSRLIVVNDLS